MYKTEENLFSQIGHLQSLHLPLYFCDASGKLSYYNEQAVELWGIEPSFDKGLWPEDWKFLLPTFIPLRADQHPLLVAIREKTQPEKQEFVIERPNGTNVNILSCPHLVYDNNGVLLGGYDILVDISSIRNTNEEMSVAQYRTLSFDLSKELSIKRNEERYHKMVEEVQDYAILLLDVDGTIMNWNKGAEKIKGYKENEIIGKNFRIFYLDEDREKMLPEKLIQIAVNEGKAMQEGWRKRKDGSKFWGFIVITALHDKEDNVIGFSKVTRDLSERKESEDQLKLYAKNIEIKNKQLEEYAYVASHDLQEPLRKIQIFTELLEKNFDSKDLAKKHLEKINSSAKRMSTLIKDVLKYSQLSQLDDLWSEVDLNKVLQDVMDDHDLLIEEKEAKIKVDKMPKLKAISVQMHQLFSNLLGNALKFTADNPSIEVSCKKVLASDHTQQFASADTISFYKIQFKDNGVGFEPKYAEHVFKLFKRLHDDHRGNGIGLALCQKIVENHKGSIAVSSKRNKGTVFTIYLPS